MQNSYDNLLCVQARSPELLKRNLMAIPTPSSVMQGSWFMNGSLYGCWVLLDRPVTQVSKKEFKAKKDKVEITAQTKTIKE